MSDALTLERGPVCSPSSMPKDLVSADYNLGIYTVEATQRYWYGARWLRWDGAVFKYCLSGAACRTGRGAKFLNAIPATGIDYSALARVQAIGDTKVLMTNQGVVAQTKDCLAGGTIFISDEDDDTPTDGKLQQRLIIGNTAATISGTCEITLDAPLNRAVLTTTYAWCMPNPYNNVGFGTDPYMSCAGLPATYVSASGYHFWLQTWGLCWIAFQTGSGNTGHARGLVFRHDGSLETHMNAGATGGTGTNYPQQHAGFIVDNNAAINGATVAMLQVSI